MKKNRILLFVSLALFITLVSIKNYYVFDINKTKDVLIYLGIVLITIIPLMWTPYLKKTFNISANIKSELRRITWAKKEDVIKGFGIVIVFVTIIGLFVIFSDYILFEAYSLITR